jgi:hypothetical protein
MAARKKTGSRCKGLAYPKRAAEIPVDMDTVSSGE